MPYEFDPTTDPHANAIARLPWNFLDEEDEAVPQDVSTPQFSAQLPGAGPAPVFDPTSDGGPNTVARTPAPAVPGLHDKAAASEQAAGIPVGTLQNRKTGTGMGWMFLGRIGQAIAAHRQAQFDRELGAAVQAQHWQAGEPLREARLKSQQMAQDLRSQQIERAKRQNAAGYDVQHAHDVASGRGSYEHENIAQIAADAAEKERQRKAAEIAVTATPQALAAATAASRATAQGRGAGELEYAPRIAGARANAEIGARTSPGNVAAQATLAGAEAKARGEAQPEKPPRFAPGTPLEVQQIVDRKIAAMQREKPGIEPSQRDYDELVAETLPHYVRPGFAGDVPTPAGVRPHPSRALKGKQWNIGTIPPPKVVGEP